MASHSQKGGLVFGGVMINQYMGLAPSSFRVVYTPGKLHPGRLTWNLCSYHQFIKENDLPNLHDYVPAVNLQGCSMKPKNHPNWKGKSSRPWVPAINFPGYIPRKLTWQSKTNDEWRCISYWTWGFSNVMFISRWYICLYLWNLQIRT